MADGEGTRRDAGTVVGTIGLLLVAGVWPANWLLSGPRTHLLFFPLWLGYVLIVDGLVRRRGGRHRSAGEMARLFLASAPVWWIFEAFNLRLGNWEYVGRELFGYLEYFLLCSVAFSTVLPAVLRTADLVRTAPWIERFARGPCVRPSARMDRTLVILGVAGLILALAFPRFFFAFVWTSFVFLLEPLCRRLGRLSLLTDLRDGDWRRWASLWIGVLVCAFFWEMWNVHSYPKWIYHVPWVDFLHVFEMPLLGYLGYLPFALELYLFEQLLLGGRNAR